MTRKEDARWTDALILPAAWGMVWVMKTFARALLVVGLVPWNSMAADAVSAAPASGSIVELSESGIIHPHQVFTVLTYEAPREFLLGNTGLKEAGLKAGAFPPGSDEIRVFVDRTATNSAPMARIWINDRQEGAYWFITGGEGDAAGFVIPKGAMVVVWTRASTEPVTWKNVFE